jgi:hypothetical protein
MLHIEGDNARRLRKDLEETSLFALPRREALCSASGDPTWGRPV